MEHVDIRMSICIYVQEVNASKIHKAPSPFPALSS